ncbi:hypothetical protein [Sphingopyxis flava]|uniref:Uncharacterized protein n=1 Tax=Sphingopyxis flava TaxID=1507287 RepID=A0A1T5CTU0_9SPHN|nr:hypothetical protein [Sphingopyxis flava]SKB62756.1 hypothetical protein SAMN06295937_1011103 [Sphingopyxis flava]
MPPRPRPVVGEYDPKLQRVRTHSDDFYDHRKAVLDRIRQALAAEKRK